MKNQNSFAKVLGLSFVACVMSATPSRADVSQSDVDAVLGGHGSANRLWTLQTQVKSESQDVAKQMQDIDAQIAADQHAREHYIDEHPHTTSGQMFAGRAHLRDEIEQLQSQRAELEKRAKELDSWGSKLADAPAPMKIEKAAPAPKLAQAPKPAPKVAPAPKAVPAPETTSSTGEDSCDSRNRAISIAWMFAEGGSCAKLSEGARAAIRNSSDDKALAEFRKIKADWLRAYFDGYSNDQQPLSVRLKTFSNSLAEQKAQLEASDISKEEKDQKLLHIDRVTQQIAAVFKAIDAIRPDGGLTAKNLARVTLALNALPKAEFNTDMVAAVNGSSWSLGELRDILRCRLADNERKRLLAKEAGECGSPARRMPPLASVFTLFVGDVAVVPATPAEAVGSSTDSAARPDSGAKGGGPAPASTASGAGG